jgi:phage/plasmid-associated DNA primase
LKDKINNGIYKQFILLLIEKAVEYKDKQLVQPSDVENQTKEYFDENDPVKGWLANICLITNCDKDRIKTSELYNKYLYDGNPKISMVKFSEYMKQNDIEIKLFSGYKFFTKLIIKNTINEFDL